MTWQRVTDDLKWTIMYFCGQGASIIKVHMHVIDVDDIRWSHLLQSG